MSPPVLAMTNPLAIAGKAVSPLTAAISGINPLAKKVLVLLFSAYVILSKQYKRILWPGSGPDRSHSEALPASSLGCPLLGQIDAFSGSKEHGPFAGIAKVAAKLGNPKLFRMYTYGFPITSVSGLNNIKTALSREFEDDGINTMLLNDNWSDLFGGESVLYEGDKKKHASLRRLVGSAMSPSAIGTAVPAIQAVAERQVDSMLKLEGQVVKVEDVVTDYTLGIAHRQILGLDLQDGEEVDEFHRNTKDWLTGMTNPLIMLPFRVPGLKRMKAFRGHDYLVAKVEEKLARLDRDGPDESTLSKMYFATDDGDEEGSSTRKLTRQQVIDNSLILIVAGTETSSSTLTVASLLLGLYPDVWQKVKEEQRELQSKYGDALSKKQLEECTYLDSVIKETMRIRPIEGMELRKTKETIVVDGKQIPKNSLVYSNVRQTHFGDAATFADDGSHMDLKKGFDPGRWLDPARKPAEFMGFGEGGRRCLGERLAYTEMKIFLATLARKMDFDLVASPEDEVLWNKDAFMSRPIDGTEVIPRRGGVATKTTMIEL
eukprot:CAMPEP_0197464174 /NCGR_PEP_ID=MMETSP1175-20131217/63792_1 /TAXON_ID=1003142 /ORGANISM="Triceratium dubium, Strain CCMP147" /LENGTH=544 /DNA_ID=CAMNT_0043000119 /DNA_START=227 /DNA_END=1861 /DNA_ORIENTATION=+